jgi:hypothetical protein
VLPTVLSLTGVGSAGLSTILTYRTPFVAASAVLVGWSMYTTIRGDAWWVNKALTFVASGIAFSLAAGWLL